MDLTMARIAFDVECGLLNFWIQIVHGFESIVLEDFLQNFVPQIFVGGELGRI
jgi:hypothetical protein